MLCNIQYLSSLTKIKPVYYAEYKQELNVPTAIYKQSFLQKLKDRSFKRIPYSINLIIEDCIFEEYNFSNIQHSRVQKYRREFGTNHELRLINKYVDKNCINLVTKLAGEHILKISKNGSWLLGHKLGHGILLYDDFLQNILHSHIQRFYNLFYKTTYSQYNANYHGWGNVFKEISNFKSVRENLIFKNLEYLCELIAQYCYYGKIKFKYPNRIFSSEAHANCYAMKVTTAITDAMNNCVGSIVYDVF